ncbi:MAG TPA: type II secretion system protein [Pirellulales bacterium]|nr:type II secretion system protein [Pirellulales bacterium]
MNASTLQREPGNLRESRRRREHRAFSLLELILALSILIGALAVIGELMRSGLRNAQMARDLSQAQLLCETKLAEIQAGAAAAEPASQTPVPNHPGWLVSVERETTSSQNASSSSTGQSGTSSQGFSGTVSLYKIRVTVEQDPQQQRNPVKFSLSQWMIDPSVSAVQLQPLIDPGIAASASQSGSSQSGGTGQ